MTWQPIITKDGPQPDSIVFRCERCNHWALAAPGKTLCYVCEEVALEDMTAAKLRELVGRDDANILEIGANDGSHTVQFLEAFPTGSVICFECEPRAIKEWKAAVKDPRALLIEAAVADTPSVRKFHPSGGKPPGKDWEHIDSWHCSGSLLRDDQHTKECDWLTFGEPFDVNVMALDDFFATNREAFIGCMWIDVQGAEALVLKGGQETLKRTEWVFLECHAKPFYHGQATFDELVALLPGFVLHGMYSGDNYLFRRVSP